MRFRSVFLVIAGFVGLVFAHGAGLLGAVGQTTTSARLASTAFPAPTLPSTTLPPDDLQPQADSSTAASASPTTTTAPPVTTTTTTPTTTTAALKAAPTTTTAPAAPQPTVVVRATGAELPIFAQAGDADPSVSLTTKTEFGTQRVMVATGRRGDWWRVLLPLRPNGSTGWVRGSDVAVDQTSDAIFVDLSARTLTWARGGKILLRSSVAVGSPASPTPKGYFYVTDVLPYDANGEYGAWVLALNGHSDTFTEFNGGDARIAIHGTNDPTSIGRAASFGCVRVPADALAKLAAGVPVGTPVVIQDHVP